MATRTPLPSLLAALAAAAPLAATGCAPEEAELPLAPPELSVAGSAAADSADPGAADDLVCDWGPVENREGEVTVRCYRLGGLGDIAATAAPNQCLCWYLVTYRCRRMECVKVGEDFVGCDPGCGGDGQCTQEQNDIANEYATGLYSPRGGPRRNWSGSCHLFVDTDFASGDGTHDHTVGYLHGTYRAHKPTIRRVVSGLVVTSDWRCPSGNAAVGGSVGSWHMEGNGGDFAHSNGDTLTQQEYRRLRERAEQLNAGGISGYGWPCEGCPWQYKRHIHIDWR